MTLVQLNRDPSARQVRQFGLWLLPGFCLLLAALSIYRQHAWGIVGGLTAGAAASMLLTAVRPEWMRALLIAWMWITFPIGWFVSHLMMGAIYFLVLTPIGWIMRLAGRDPLERRFDPQATTYWTVRQEKRDPASYFRQF